MLRKLAILGLAAYGAKKLIERAGLGAAALESISRPTPRERDAGTTGPGAAAALEAAHRTTTVGHVTTDLSGDTHPDGSQRADDHFRPDLHASVPPEDIEGLRPVTVKPAKQPLGV
jgi:hypothetical protein